MAGNSLSVLSHIRLAVDHEVETPMLAGPVHPGGSQRPVWVGVLITVTRTAL